MQVLRNIYSELWKEPKTFSPMPQFSVRKEGSKIKQRKKWNPGNEGEGTGGVDKCHTYHKSRHSQVAGHQKKIMRGTQKNSKWPLE